MAYLTCWAYIPWPFFEDERADGDALRVEAEAAVARIRRIAGRRSRSTWDVDIARTFPQLSLEVEVRGRPVPRDVYTSVYWTGERADADEWNGWYLWCNTLPDDMKIQWGKRGGIKKAVSVLKSNCGEILHTSVCWALYGFFDVEDNRTLAYSNGIEDALMLVNGLHPLSAPVFDILLKLMTAMPELDKKHTLMSLKIRSTLMNTALGTSLDNTQYKELLMRGRENISPQDVDVAMHDAIIFKSIGQIIISENMFASGHQSKLACWFYKEGLVHEMIAMIPSINKETGLKLAEEGCFHLVQLGISHCKKLGLGQPCYFDTGEEGKFYWSLGKMLLDIVSDDDNAAENLHYFLGRLLTSERQIQVRKLADRQRYNLCFWMIRESHFMTYSAGTLLLAKCYFNGFGVETNIGTGFNLLSTAYWVGNTDASAICRALTTKTTGRVHCVFGSPDITADYKQAFELLTLAIQSGHDGCWFPNFKNIPNCDSSEFEFKKFVEGLKSTAICGLTFAVKQSARSQLLNISKCYENRFNGLVMNLSKAVIFTKASNELNPYTPWSTYVAERLKQLRQCSYCRRNPGNSGGSKKYCPCFTVRYCDRECQKMDWARCHKTDCKAFREQIMINVPSGLLN